MKILMFSYYDTRSKDKYSFKDIANLTLSSKEEYCKIHGYDFVNCEIDEYWREIGWYKIDVIKDKLQYYDWIFYCEADCLITNLTKRIEDIIDDNKYLIISKNSISPSWTGLNCGNLIIKNSEWSQYFINFISEKKEFYHHEWAEQKAIIDEFEKNANMINHTKLTTMRQMGGFRHQWYEKDNWQLGDWIMHLAGCSNEYRYNVFNELKDKIIKAPDYKLSFEPFI